MMSDHSAIDASTPGASPLYFDADNGVARVVLDRPKSINALSEEMLSALQSCLDDIAADRSIRAVILRSSGDHFCAGHNLKEMTARRADADGGKTYFVELFETCSKLMKTILRLPQPMIAEVRGIATAAGCQLAAACDLAVAADTAKFATSGVNIGLFCSTPMVALTRNVPRKVAMEMLVTGDFIDAEAAARYGLVNRAVPPEELDEAVHALAAKIAGQSPASIALGKQLFYRQVEAATAAAYEMASGTMACNMTTEDARDGIDAFIAKQPRPEWKGR